MKQELYDWLLNIGYPKSRDEVIGIVRQTLVKKGVPGEDFKGRGWWLQRWPQLTLRKGDALAHLLLMPVP